MHDMLYVNCIAGSFVSVKFISASPADPCRQVKGEMLSCVYKD